LTHTQSHTAVLVLKNDPQQIAKVEKFLLKAKRLAHLDEDQFNKLLIATTEAVNNSIIHGNKRDSTKNVTLTCIVNNAAIVIRVHDEGEGFEHDSLPDPLAVENLLREHGRGVFLIRSMMDDVTFEKTNGGSDVVMTMRL
jgi:serine/threonine-protein kinase RsbW